MKKSLLFILILLFNSMNYSQEIGKLRGKVMDKEEGDLLVKAILKISGNNLTDSVVTDLKGKFLFKSLTYGEYIVECRYIGFRLFKEQITIKQPDTSILINMVEGCTEREEWEVNAGNDIKNNNIKIYMNYCSLFSYNSPAFIDSVSKDFGFDPDYSGSSDIKVRSIDECFDIYNNIILNYLDERYGNGWLEKYKDEYKSKYLSK